METWKDIIGYEGLYQVSDKGRVRSLRFGKIRYLKSAPHKKGYRIVGLCLNGKMKSFKIHRLVAEAFIPNPDNLPCVNHKDEDKTNNCVENLEFCTYEYNVNYGTCREKLSLAKKGKPSNTTGKHWRFDENGKKCYFSYNSTAILRNSLSFVTI